MTAKPHPWDRVLWGIEFTGGSKNDPRTLIGTGWARDLVVGPQYDGEPTRALLFETRMQARNWCANQMRNWRAGRKQGDLVLLWKVRPVRVREIVEVAK